MAARSRKARSTEPRNVDLPRVQAGSNPQHLILGLFTDYWFGQAAPLPSGALVALLEAFDVSTANARQAINRLAKRGVLVASKQGRRTFYALHDDAAEALAETQLRVSGFGASDRDWDGTWTTVLFKLPDDQRDQRYGLRTRLRWLGFAPLYDGVWVSPRADEGQTVELLERVPQLNATVLRSPVVFSTGGGDPLAAWDLDAVRERYDEFIARFAALARRVRSGRVGRKEALVARTRVKEFWWRELINVDPELPEHVLPADWPRKEARRIFEEIYDGLAERAAERVQALVAEHDDALAAHVTPLTTKRPPARS